MRFEGEYDLKFLCNDTIIKNVGGGKGGWGWMIYFWVFPGVLIG